MWLKSAAIWDLLCLVSLSVCVLSVFTDCLADGHQLTEYNFSSLQRCHMCDNFLWGLMRQGLQCRGRLLQIHYINLKLPNEQMSEKQYIISTTHWTRDKTLYPLPIKRETRHYIHYSLNERQDIISNTHWTRDKTFYPLPGERETRHYIHYPVNERQDIISTTRWTRDKTLYPPPSERETDIISTTWWTRDKTLYPLPSRLLQIHYINL